MPILAPLVVTQPGTPATTPTSRPQPIHLQHDWTGWDGSKWDLCSDDSGTRLGAGVRGLTTPPRDRWVSVSPSRPGSFPRGSRTLERSVFWPLRVYTPNNADWYEYDAAFWRTMRADKTGVWTVTNPVTGTVRRLRLEFVDDSDHAVDTDPALLGWMRYGINLVATQPYWYGPPVTRSFANEPPVPFFAADHDPVPATDLLFISSGSTLASASIDNPGDIDAYPIYVLDGPWDTGATVGIDDNLTTYNAAIAAGKSVVIDTRPDRLGAKEIDTPAARAGSDEWMDALDEPGTDMFTSLGSLALNTRVSAGEDVAVDISATGQGNVHIALTPMWERAW